MPEIPVEIIQVLQTSDITGTTFECKNDILSDEKLHTEVGYRKMDDGSYLVSMVCPMPGITVDMIEWWFWWSIRETVEEKQPPFILLENVDRLIKSPAKQCGRDFGITLREVTGYYQCRISGVFLKRILT